MSRNYVWLAIAGSGLSVFALTPPAFPELCRLKGTVIRTGSQAQTNAFNVPESFATVTVEISDLSPSGIREPSYLSCKKSKREREVTFRVCDETQWKKNQAVQAIVGRSKSGGPLCLEREK